MRYYHDGKNKFKRICCKTNQTSKTEKWDDTRISSRKS